MMPLHLVNATLDMPLSIVDDNARMPSDDLLDKSCSYRRKRKSSGAPPSLPPLKPSKPSRWDAIPVSKKLPSMMPRANMTLNECARMTLRRPVRMTEENNHADKLHQPLRRPTRTSGYADAASILEMALAEVSFSDNLANAFSDDEPMFNVGS